MLNYDKLMAYKIPDVEQAYSERDCIIYGLGLGLGLDPLDENQLRFVYERGLQTLPTMSVVLTAPQKWLSEANAGIDYSKLVHGEQELEIFAPLPTSGRLRGTTKIIDVVDKGPGRGALIVSRTVQEDMSTRTKIATITQTVFARGDGGFGGDVREMPEPHAVPDRKPDYVRELPTSSQAALLYRLNGDINPLHCDPEVAEQAGFPRPILHGLATFGLAGFALLDAICGYDATRFHKMAARFTAPIFPGETLKVEIWEDDGMYSFRCRAVERNIVAIDNGKFRVK